jgi:hypothetical protein
MSFDLDPNTSYAPTEFTQVVTNGITLGDTSVPNTAYKMPVIQGKKNQTMFLTDSSVNPAIVTFQNPGLVLETTSISVNPAVVNTEYLANTSGGPITITLPNTPDDGVSVTIVDSTGSFSVSNMTIQTGASDKINGGSVGASEVLSTAYTTTTYKYIASTNTWVKIAAYGGEYSLAGAVNVGASGIGVFKQVAGTDIELKKINSANTKLSVVDVSDVITLTVQESLFSHLNISDIGTNTHTQIDTHLANVANPHAVTKRQVCLGKVLDILHNINAVVTPTITDDTASNYSVGSTWTDTIRNKSYICVDSNISAAIWKPITPEVLNKYDSTSAPTINNDNTTPQGYSVGSQWFNTTNNKAYMCLDATIGAAVWKEISKVTNSNAWDHGAIVTRWNRSFGDPTTSAIPMACLGGNSAWETLDNNYFIRVIDYGGQTSRINWNVGTSYENWEMRLSVKFSSDQDPSSDGIWLFGNGAQIAAGNVGDAEKSTGGLCAFFDVYGDAGLKRTRCVVYLDGTELSSTLMGTKLDISRYCTAILRRTGNEIFVRWEDPTDGTYESTTTHNLTSLTGTRWGFGGRTGGSFTKVEVCDYEVRALI